MPRHMDTDIDMLHSRRKITWQEAETPTRDGCRRSLPEPTNCGPGTCDRDTAPLPQRPHTTSTIKSLQQAIATRHCTTALHHVIAPRHCSRRTAHLPNCTTSLQQKDGTSPKQKRALNHIQGSAACLVRLLRLVTTWKAPVLLPAASTRAVETQHRSPYERADHGLTRPPAKRCAPTSSEVSGAPLASTSAAPRAASGSDEGGAIAAR